jgi:hypothetical protein
MTRDQYTNTPYQSEAQFTAATFRYMNANYPQLRHLFFHVPNEQATSDLMRMQQKGMGVLAGVPDFLFVWPVTWGLELKWGNGRVSERQEALHRLWNERGIPVEVAYTPEQVLAVLEKYVNS